MPLQAFWPLQALAPPLQALWPLQALPAMHLPRGGVRSRRHRRHHGAGEEQRGGGSGERCTGFGIQLHDDLLDDCLKTRVTPWGSVDRSIKDPARRERGDGCQSDRGGLPETCRSPRFECSSETSYGASGDLVTEFQKKIFFFLHWAPRPCLNPGGSRVFHCPRSCSSRPRAAPERAALGSRFGRDVGGSIALHNEIRWSYPRTGFSLAICATVARNSSALKEGNEQMRLL